MYRNVFRVKDDRHSYTQWFLYSSCKKVYVDETGFSLWTKRNFCRSRVGERVNRFVASNATVIAATAAWAATLFYELHFGNVIVDKCQIFMVSFEEILGNAHVVVAMDNVPVYIGVCESFSDLNIIFLPSYLPFFIPNENCFLVFKVY